MVCPCAHAAQLEMARMAQDNPHDIKRLLEGTVAKLARNASSTLGRCADE